MFVSPQIHLLKPNPLGDGIWRWCLKDGTPICALIKETFLISKPEYSKEMAIYEPENKSSSDTDSAFTFIITS